MKNLAKFEAEFKATFPKAWVRVGDFYGDGETTLWSGEDCFTDEGALLFDYYEESGYDVHPKLAKMAQKYGYFFECYDPGTYIAVEM